MDLVFKNVKYHRDKKEVVKITEAQALLILSDMLGAVLAQNGFTADIEVK